MVRDKIKHFASLAVGKAPPKKAASSFFTKVKETHDEVVADREDESYPNPPFKIIILDEAGEDTYCTAFVALS